MLQYYLRAEGLALSWVGTGRLIFSLNYADGDYAAVMDRFLAACRTMQRDGWWWVSDSLTNRSIKRQILWEMLTLGRRRDTNPAAPIAPEVIPPHEKPAPGEIAPARASSDQLAEVND